MEHNVTYPFISQLTERGCKHKHVCLFVCIVCLLTGLLKKLRVDCHEIWGFGRLRAKEELVDF